MFKSNRFYHCIAGCKSLTNWRKRTSTSTIFRYAFNVRNWSDIRHSMAPNKFKARKALVVTKMTRFEFEKHRNPTLTDFELAKKIGDRGTHFDNMLLYHNNHKKFERNVVQCFEEAGIEVMIVNRLTINNEAIIWADIVVPIGGDGTFLMAAGRSSPYAAMKTPIVGFNSDPIGSEGRLLLPKQCSSNLKSTVQRIVNGEFKWMLRSRIRTTIMGTNGNMPMPTDLHELKAVPLSQNEPELQKLDECDQEKYKATVKRILPYLALNEIFIGETLSARVSHIQLKVDDSGETTKTKCSGMCVTTGTGSTSWHTSINRLSTTNVVDLLKILNLKYNFDGDKINPKTIADAYNQRLVFGTDDHRLCFSIREQICGGVWPNPQGLESRGFARKLYVKSRCFDASLVIDGSITYTFNDGTKALLEVHPEDALVSIALD